MSTPLCDWYSQGNCDTSTCVGADSNEVEDDTWKNYCLDDSVSASSDMKLLYHCANVDRKVVFSRVKTSEVGRCESIWRN